MGRIDIELSPKIQSQMIIEISEPSMYDAYYKNKNIMLIAGPVVGQKEAEVRLCGGVWY